MMSTLEYILHFTDLSQPKDGQHCSKIRVRPQEVAPQVKTQVMTTKLMQISIKKFWSETAEADKVADVVKRNERASGGKRL